MSRKEEKQLITWISKYINTSYLNFLGVASQALKYSQLPMMRLLQLVQRTTVQQGLVSFKRRRPWLSNTELVLSAHSLRQEGVEAGRFFEELDTILESVEEGFLLLLSYQMKSSNPREERERIAFVARVLRSFDPATLQAFEQYIEWKSQGMEADELADVAAKKVLIQDAWQHRSAVDALPTLENLGDSPLPWKHFYIASTFRNLASSSLDNEKQERVLHTLFLFLENREALDLHLF